MSISVLKNLKDSIDVAGKFKDISTTKKGLASYITSDEFKHLQPTMV